MSIAPRSRRLSLVAASVLVLGLTACGGQGPGGPAAAPQPPVIRIGAAGSPGGAAETSMAADSKMMANLTFVLDGQAPDLTSPAGSWVFPAGTRASDDAVAALAAAFGLTGTPSALPADQGGGRVVGSTDYTGASLTVTDDALSSWWYNPDPTMTAPACLAEPGVIEPGVIVEPGVIEPGVIVEPGVTSDATPAPDAPLASDAAVDPVPVEGTRCEPVVPSGVPTAEQAEAKARELFASVGIDPSAYRFENYADEWGATATGFLIVDGVRTSLAVSVGYGAEGALTWASGFLATPQRNADYPRIGVEAAVERLNAQQAGMMFGAGWMAADAAATRGGAEPAVEPAVELDCTDPATSCVEPAAPVTAVDPVLIDPPYEEIPAEPIVVRLGDPQPSLEQIWDVDGTVWLVPGYSFSSDDGGMWSVTAIPDQYLQTDTPTVDTVPVDTAPVDTVPVDTAPVDTVPLDTVPVTGDEAWDLHPSGPTSVDMASQALVGRTVDELGSIPWTVRIAREDGVDLAVTADLQPERVNVAVVDGVITEVIGLG